MVIILVLSSSAWAVETGALGGDKSIDVGLNRDTLANHDGTIENGYAWSNAGMVEPYFGAWAEGFDLPGGGTVTSITLILTTTGASTSTLDLYLFDGGVTGPPANILYDGQDVVVTGIAVWPNVSYHTIEITPTAVPSEFTAGFCGNWFGAGNEFYIGVDEDGPGGHPWTNIHEGTGYPAGWQHPNIVSTFALCQSMGIEVTTGGTTASDPSTWGNVKALF
jgi:hypothetical protein